MKSSYRFLVLPAIICAGILSSCINKDTPTGVGTVQPDSMQLYSGNNQNGIIETRSAMPLVVRILSANKQPVANVFVEFAASSGKATFSDPLPKTDANGLAQTYCLFGTTADTMTVFAVCSGLKGSPVAFTMHSFPGTAALISIAKAPAFQVAAGMTTGVTALVTDQRKNPVPNAAVNFRMTKGGGSFSSASVLTDTAGNASAIWVVDTLQGAVEAEAAINGVSGASVTMKTTVIPAVQARVVIMDGNGQICFTGATAPVRLTATAVDKYGNYVSDAAALQFTCTTPSIAALGTTIPNKTPYPARSSVDITMKTAPGEVHVLAAMPPAVPAEFVLRSYSLVTLSPLALTSGGVQIQWTQTPDASFTAYKIFKSTSPGVTAGSTLIATITDRTVTGFVDADIIRGSYIHYYYRIQISFANSDALFTDEEYIVP